MATRQPPTPPTAPPAMPTAAAGLPARLLPGQQLLIYAPEGPLGGTFTCVHCRAQAWQPDLLEHAAHCPARWAAPPPMTPG